MVVWLTDLLDIIDVAGDDCSNLPDQLRRRTLFKTSWNFCITVLTVNDPLVLESVIGGVLGRGENMDAI